MLKISNNPVVSVIVVNFNGKKWLKKCFDSLSKQTYRHLEVILVDNASTDGSVELVEKQHKRIKIVKLKENVGFAGGNNEGYKHAKGKYILLLNNDTEVESNFVEELLSAFNHVKNLGIVQSKLILTNKKQLDTCGGFWTYTSFLYYVGNYKNPNIAKYNHPFPVFTCKGAAVLIRRDLIEKIGLFDDSFWNYYEETDLCHRAWISGWECWYWPKAVCYHAMGGTSLSFSNEFIQFHNFKNKLASFIKNFEILTLIKVIPVFLTINICVSFLWLLSGKWRHCLSLYKAVWWNISNLSSLLKKRRKVFKNRKLKDSSYLSVVTKNPKLAYYPILFKGDFQNYED